MTLRPSPDCDPTRAAPTAADIERVARAIWGEWCLWSAPISAAKPAWDALAKGNKDIGLCMARAAIAAYLNNPGIR